MLNKAEYIYSVQDQDTLGKTQKIIPLINYSKPAPQRCLDMLLAKLRGEPFQTEVVMEEPEKISIPVLEKPLNQTTVLLLTDGGLVPRGNPDRIPSTNACCFGVYSIAGKRRLQARDYEVSHQGYDFSYVREDPNRLLPVDALRELERMGVIGRLYDHFLSTAGVMTSSEDSIRLGQQIADYVEAQPVDAVLITSACGTSTRCGAYIGMAIESRGIPVVQVTNLTQISADTGISRIVKGNNICYPYGKPSLDRSGEYNYRRQLVMHTLQMLKEMSE